MRSKRRLILALAASCSLALVAIGAAASDGGAWSARQIGDPGFVPLAVNDEGVVAGVMGSYPAFQAVVWEDGVTTYLKVPPNTIRSDVGGINNLGQVVGSVTVELQQPPPNTQQQAVLWDADGEYTLLGFLPGGSYSFAVDINDEEEVVGFGGFPGYMGRAFLWDKGVITLLPIPTAPPCPPGGCGGRPTSSYAQGINNAGQIVGRVDFPSASRALVWDEDGLTELPPLAPGSNAYAMDINDSGQIVGGSWDRPPGVPTPVAHAVAWDEGLIVDLGTLGGGASASAINNAGQIVGSMADTANVGHAYVWEDFVGTSLPPLAGDVQTGAGGINESGQIIGASISSTGTLKGVMWTAKGASEQVADLIALVDSYSLTKLGTSLHDKLVNVQQMLDSDQPNKACEILGAFISQVKAQNGKGLTPAQATELTTKAQQIKNTIGC